MLIWKQRIAHELTKEAQERPNDAVYVGNYLLDYVKCDKYAFNRWDLDELIK